MMNAKVSDVIVQVAATVIATGIIALLVQVTGVFRRLSAVEQGLRDVKAMVSGHHNEFHESHQRYDDGEYHHRRSGRV